MFAKHANIAVTKRATMCSIVKLKNISKTLLNLSMFAKHANIAATKRATMHSIVKVKNISKIQKKSLHRQLK
jgi:hypothetical protein